MRKLQKVGVAAGPSFNIEELVNDPHVKNRESLLSKTIVWPVKLLFTALPGNQPSQSKIPGAVPG